jgi:hypothetical protein
VETSAQKEVAVRSISSRLETDSGIVLHEFAHLLDFEDGSTTGVPALDGGESPSAGRSRLASWARVLGALFKKLRAGAQNGEEVDLDIYGATNPAEFFAVATESFFERPRAMQGKHPELYEQLKGFYRQDPARWNGKKDAGTAPGFVQGESDGFGGRS